jgi:hypothetical protein
MRARLIMFFISFMLIAGLAGTSYAQDTITGTPPQKFKSPPKKKYTLLERMDFGGYLGAQFGTVTLIEISPIASYRVTPNFHFGLGFTYQYYQDNRYTPDYKSSAYGANIFGRYFIWRDLFAHVEYAPVYITDSYYGTIDQGIWAHDFMIGGGYRQWIGNKAFMTFMILWNVNETPQSLYRNPIIKIGFGAGI